MEYESIDKFECSPEKCMGVYQHPSLPENKWGSKNDGQH